jgi:polysaccharide export outer membrane protein
VVDLIAEAGGLTEEAGDVAILTKKARGGRNATELDLNSLLTGKSSGQNTWLVNGDRVFVPRMQQFYVYGEVNKPGAYRLEKDLTVIQAISVAGGLTSRGTERGLTIKRKSEGAGDASSLKVELFDEVQADDVIYVKESLF